MSGLTDLVVIILMGPMGCGKTTIGHILSHRTGMKFIDSDDYHPPENVEKMARGMALDDKDRYPWLKRLKGLIEDALTSNESIILACSALKHHYRVLLGVDQQQVISVYLKGDMALLEQRVADRSHQYMDKGLLASQFAALEEPKDGLIVSVATTAEQTATAILEQLRALYVDAH